jgi:hypothetical protein
MMKPVATVMSARAAMNAATSIVPQLRAVVSRPCAVTMPKRGRLLAHHP